MSEPVKTMYAIHPGNVRARDGDLHYVGANALIRLYKVHPQMCVIAKDGWDRMYSPDFLKQFIHLYPREDGNYDLSAGSEPQLAHTKLPQSGSKGDKV